MASDPLSDLLSGVLRGAGHPNAQEHVQNSSSDALSDMLGSILSGGGQQQQRQMPQQQSSGNAMGDMLGSLLGGGQQQSGGNAMGDMLGSLLGGGQQQSGGNAMGDNAMGDMLGSLLGGGQQQQSSGNAMGNILGSLLGGGQQQPQRQMPQQQQSSDVLSGLLGSILGSSPSPAPAYPAQSHAQAGGSGVLDVLGSLIGGSLQGGQGSFGGQGGGLMDMIGMMMGANQMGGLGAIAGTPFAPIIAALAKKMGVNPIIASVVVGFLLNKVFSSHAQPQQNQRMAQQSSIQDNLLGVLGAGKQIDHHYIQQSGMANELSHASGLNSTQSADALHTLLGMLGGNVR